MKSLESAGISLPCLEGHQKKPSFTYLKDTNQSDDTLCNEVTGPDAGSQDTANIAKEMKKDVSGGIAPAGSINEADVTTHVEVLKPGTDEYTAELKKRKDNHLSSQNSSEPDFCSTKNEEIVSIKSEHENIAGNQVSSEEDKDERFKDTKTFKRPVAFQTRLKNVKEDPDIKSENGVNTQTFSENPEECLTSDSIDHSNAAENKPGQNTEGQNEDGQGESSEGGLSLTSSQDRYEFYRQHSEFFDHINFKKKK